MVHRARWIYPALVSVLIILYFTVPGAHVPIVAIVGILAAATVAAVALLGRPPRWGAWLLIATGILIIAAGEMTFDLYAVGGKVDKFPSTPDVMSLVAYVPLAIGMLWLGLPKTPSMDWTAVIETAALSLAGVLILWIWLIRPTVDSMHLTGAGKIAAVAMWVGDVIVLVAALRLLIVWRTSTSATLLALGTVALFLADLRYGFDLLNGVWRSGGQVDAGLLLFNALCGAAVLAPSMHAVGSGWPSERRVGSIGIVSLAIALLVAPTVLLVESTPGPVTTGAAIGIVSFLIGLLVVLRLIFWAGLRQRTDDRDAIVRRGMRQLGLAMSHPDVVKSLGTTLAELGRRGGTSVSVDTEKIGEGTPEGAGDLRTRSGTSMIEPAGSESRKRWVMPTARSDGHRAAPAAEVRTIPPPDDERSSGRRPLRRYGELRVPVRADGDDWRDIGRSRRSVMFRGAVVDLVEFEDQLIGLAEVAGVALDRIDLAARVRRGEREQDLLAYRATHDALTGLANAELFRDELRAASRSAVPGHLTGVLFIDLDDFKTINDTLGHDAGDEVLRSTATRLKSCLRRDDLGARLGGDEFAAVLRGLADADDGAIVARRATAALAEPTTIAGVPVVCKASVGLAVASSPVEYDALLRKADSALYAAKAAGKGRFRAYDPGMVNPMRRNSDLRLELERALRSDSADAAAEIGLAVHYQPILELVGSAVIGFEALIRWQHPRRGAIRVPEVILLAENTGLILPLGEWVFRRALADGQQIAAANGAYVSVNVSVSQLRLTGFIDRIRAQLSSSDLDPHRLVLEITESQLVGDSETIWRDLATLRELGVRVAIDDYGTGYASLAYLRHPVIDIIKLDQTFAKDVDEPRNRLLVKSVADLAAELGLPLIAEGIEDVATRSALIDLGCPLGQGHLYAPAMPLDQALTWTPRPLPAPARD